MGPSGGQGHTALRTATTKGKSPLFPTNAAAVWFPQLEAVNSRSSGVPIKSSLWLLSYGESFWAPHCRYSNVQLRKGERPHCLSWESEEFDSESCVHALTSPMLKDTGPLPVAVSLRARTLKAHVVSSQDESRLRDSLLAQGISPKTAGIS